MATEDLRGKHVVLGVSGSIAAYKAVYLLRLLTERHAVVWPVLTRGAARFVGALSFSALAGRRAVCDLWSAAEAGEIGHVELAHRAEVLVLAPASADLLNRLAAGRADDPLCAIALATDAPWVVAPAMESGMWQHPGTQASVSVLRARGAHILTPDAGALASGRAGEGRLVEPEAIVEATLTAITPQDLAGRRVLVTAGPTREPLDPARFLSNASSGKMGYAVARVARRRGARVTLVSGPTTLTPPPGVTIVPATSTEAMLQACQQHVSGADVWVMAAAPADFAPAAYSSTKHKKSDDAPAPTVPLRRTPDILKTVNARSQGVVVVGFAAESHDLVANAQTKLQAKNLDLVVANDITRDDSGFGTDTNAVTLVSRDEVTELALMSKEALASEILDRVVALEHL